jgi:hypothetical protein
VQLRSLSELLVASAVTGAAFLVEIAIFVALGLI